MFIGALDHLSGSVAEFYKNQTPEESALPKVNYYVLFSAPWIESCRRGPFKGIEVNGGSILADQNWLAGFDSDMEKWIGDGLDSPDGYAGFEIEVILS